MKYTGSDIVIECLLEQGVTTVFGYPGGTILNIYDSLYKYRDKINHILTSHEQGASHAADGYARASGEVGVCLATSGPGATNLVTGIATAYMDSIPIVAITCNVAVPLLGRDTFQEIDITGVTMPITKHNFIVKDIKDLATTIRRAFQIARSGRPGPVLIDITKDVTGHTFEFAPISIEIQKDTPKINEDDIDKIVQVIKKAKRPFIFAGGGIVSSEASKELSDFAQKIDAPVCDTLMGKGAFDNTKPRYTGMLGMHGTKVSNLGVSRCDVLIVIGARFSDRVTGNTNTFARKANIIHIDIDEAEFNKNVDTAYSVIGDAKEVLTLLNEKLPDLNHPEWMREIRDLKEKFPHKYDNSTLTGPYIVEEINRITNSEAIITTEVGQNQMWAAQYYECRRPRQFLSSGGAGTMGYGLGASLGAKMAKPHEMVINIAGDGCFRMNINELATASRYCIPIIQVVLNNQVLGMVRQWQTLFYGQRYSATVLDDGIDFVAIAKGFKCEAYRVTTKEEFAPIFEKALDAKVPVVIECMIDQDDKVWPMVAPGGAIAEAFDDKDLKEKENL